MSESSFETLWNDLQEQIGHDYRDEDERAVSCTLVALDIAKLLRSEGADPSILSITGREVDATGNIKVLVPIIYQGRVRWNKHVICAAEGIAYDPILPSPVKLIDYARLAFNEEVIITDTSTLLSEIPA